MSAPDDKMSAENLSRIAKSLEETANTLRNSHNSENYKKAVQELIDVLRNNSPVRLDIGISEVETLNQKSGSSPIEDQANATDTNSNYFLITLMGIFRSDEKTKFTSGEVNVRLVNSENDKTYIPLIHSAIPLEINDDVECKRVYEIGASFKLSAVELTPGITYKTERNYVILHPRIKGYFAGKQEGSWKYLTNQTYTQIDGTQVMKIVIKQCKNDNSEWLADCTGILKWRNKWIRINPMYWRRKIPDLGPKFKPFSIQATVVNN